MAMASAAELWTMNREQRFPALELVLLQQTFILPWTQFLYAEGAADHIRAVFTTHDVLVSGSGLDPLLSTFAAQTLTRMREPARTERFTATPGPRITALAVKPAESAKS